MGGFAGHMMHLNDNPNLTFGQMKDVFRKASQGELVGTEKTDGQNLFVSYSVRKREARAVRNSGEIKAGGLDPMGLANKFADRGDLTNTFVEGFDAFEKAVQSLPVETQIQLFGPDANNFYNAEIMNPGVLDPETGKKMGGTANVIDYDTKTLLIHRVGHHQRNKMTGEIEPLQNANLVKELERELQAAQQDQAADKYTVQVNAIRNLEALADNEPLDNAMARLDSFMGENRLNDGDTIGDYVVKTIGANIDAELPHISQELKNIILKKVLGQEKAETITQIQKKYIEESGDSEERGDWSKIKDMIDQKNFHFKWIMWPLEDIVHDFAVEMLRGLESLFILDNEKEIKRLKDEVALAIKSIEDSNNEEAMEILKAQMKKLKDKENVSTSTEGFVFDYDGNTYKFTGNFAPANQLLGLFRYGRGNVPPLRKSIREDLEVHRVPDDLDQTTPEEAYGDGYHAGRDYSSEEHEMDKVITIEEQEDYDGFDDEDITLTDDGDMMTEKADLALLPGSFKPPHKGHLYLANEYSEMADNLLILISNPQRPQSIRKLDSGDIIAPEMSQDIWDIYLENAGIANARAEISPAPSPIGAVYDYLDKLVKIGKEITVILGTSTKGGDDTEKYEGINKYKGTNVSVSVVPLAPMGVDGESLHASDMRVAIDETDEETLRKYFLPDGLSGEEVATVISIIKSQNPDPHSELEEMSGSGAGAVSGYSEPLGGKKMIHRDEMVVEMKLRELIRKKIDGRIQKNRRSGMIYINESQREMVEKYRVENALRNCIQKIILSEKTEPVPHANTGINQLSDLLKKIVPILSVGFKSLTTTAEQRSSYRSHIINAVINTLAIDRAEDEIEPEALTEAEEIDITLDDPEGEKFIDIEEPSPDEGEEQAFETLPGHDLTGRNVAIKDFDRIERIILDSYQVLDDEKDQDLFYDYLLTNLKLYFDKFEEELAGSPSEPTTPEYEQEKGAGAEPQETLQEDRPKGWSKKKMENFKKNFPATKEGESMAFAMAHKQSEKNA